MLFRPIALLAALALVPGCSMPRAGLVASAVTAVAGVALISDASNMRPSRGAFDVTPLVVSEAEVLVGSSLLVGAAVTLIASLVGFSQEHAAEERATVQAARPAMSMMTAPSALPSVPSASSPGSTPSTIAPPPPGSARAALNGRVAQLAFELRVEARAGHCATAEALALRLDRLDRAQLIALADDAAIAACTDVARAP